MKLPPFTLTGLLIGFALGLGMIAVVEHRHFQKEHVAALGQAAAAKWWEAQARALATGGRDTDAALKRTNSELAVCVGRLLVAEERACK